MQYTVPLSGVRSRERRHVLVGSSEPHWRVRRTAGATGRAHAEPNSHQFRARDLTAEHLMWRLAHVSACASLAGSDVPPMRRLAGHFASQ